MPPLSDKQCRIIRRLTEGASFEDAVQTESATFSKSTVFQAKTRLLSALQLDDITQIRLWASKITDAELQRLCARDRAESVDAQTAEEKKLSSHPHGGIIIPNTCKFPPRKRAKVTAA